jgi:hypothetical protein
MKIIMMDGSESAVFPKAYAEELGNQGHTVHYFPLAEMDIGFCTGCWFCWWRTPGKCARTDGMEKIYREVPDSDLMICYSPLVNGMISADLKKAQERLIPLLHPYIQIVKGECHHRKRYTRYPDLGLILHKPDDHDDEDVEIVQNIFKRLSINFWSSLKFCITDDLGVEEAVHETCPA